MTCDGDVDGDSCVEEWERGGDGDSYIGDEVEMGMVSVGTCGDGDKILKAVGMGWGRGRLGMGTKVIPVQLCTVRW